MGSITGVALPSHVIIVINNASYYAQKYPCSKPHYIYIYISPLLWIFIIMIIRTESCLQNS